MDNYNSSQSKLYSTKLYDYAANITVEISDKVEHTSLFCQKVNKLLNFITNTAHSTA